MVKPREQGPAAPRPSGRGALPQTRPEGHWAWGAKPCRNAAAPASLSPAGPDQAGPGREHLGRPLAGRGLRAGPAAVGGGSSSFRFSLRLLVTV